VPDIIGGLAGEVVRQATMTAQERAIANSRADLIIGLELVAHVFELKPSSHLTDPRLRAAAAAQVGGYVAALRAAGIDAVPGDPRLSPQLFPGSPQFVGNAIGPDLAGTIYGVTMNDSGTADGLLGYDLSDTGQSQLDRALGPVNDLLRGLAGGGAPFATGPVPWWVVR
jgi:hypothetical protein